MSKLLIPILLSLILSGCSIYKDYSFEAYEKEEPTSRIEFIMKDNSVLPVDAKDISMVQSSPELYILYLKNGQSLEMKKENVEKIRMTDMDLHRKFEKSLYILSTASAVLLVGAFWLLLTQL